MKDSFGKTEMEDFIDFSALIKSRLEVDQNDELMPQHPFRMLVVGGSGSGKTNMVMNLIMSKLKYDRLYLYAKDLEEDKYNFLLKYFADIQQGLKYEQKIDDNEQIIYSGTSYEDITPVDDLDKKKQNLVIFDDFITEKRHEKIEEYFIRGRKKNCSLIYISQSYTDIPKKIRLQCDYFAIYSIKSGNELINLRKEHGLGMEKEEFKRFFSEATRDKFNFALIDRRTGDDSLRFRNNFSAYCVGAAAHCVGVAKFTRGTPRYSTLK